MKHLSYLIIMMFIICAVVITLGLSETYHNRLRIGETVVICGDTLTIKDYNANYEYYILSNGLIYESK